MQLSTVIADVSVLVGAIGIFLTGITTCVLQIIAARRTKEVKTALEQSDTTTKSHLDSIHSAVNSTLGRSLEATMIFSRWKADQTQDPNDSEVANAAKKNYEDHMEKMRIDADKAAAFSAGVRSGRTSKS